MTWMHHRVLHGDRLNPGVTLWWYDDGNQTCYPEPRVYPEH
jgi:hypothetical protein